MSTMEHDKIDKLNTFLEEHVNEERVRDAIMAARIEEMALQMKSLSDQVCSLNTSWNQARGVLYFVKWVVGISGSVGAFILFIKDHVK